MTLTLNYALLALAWVLLIPITVLFIQVVLAAFAKNKTTLVDSIATPRPRIGILVPAHNEEHGLESTLRAMLPQLVTGDQLVVIADNCDDKTAEVARSVGVTTLERFNQVDRGKGFALDFGMQYLKQNPPEVVFIVDADCEVAPNLIDVVAKLCLKLQRPVQANYVMHFPAATGLKQQVTEFAWIVKNTVRPLGYRLLGLPCQLMGTGMAFLWKDILQCHLASGHLVEDMKMGLDLAVLGSSPVYCPDTHVKSYFPTSEEGQSTQRARWEHGHLGVIVSEAPKYMLKAITGLNIRLFAQVLDILVPPLALTFILNTSFWLASLVFCLYSNHSSPLIIFSINLALLFTGIFIAWLGFGRNIISLKSLILAPLILLMKIPLYIRFVISRQVDWVRSKRDH